jgi:hypothetical protein
MVIDPGMLTGTAYLKAVMQEVIWVLYQIVDLWSLQRGSLRVLGLSMVPNYPPSPQQVFQEKLLETM